MEKNIYELTVNEELERLIPPMNDMEFATLTESILVNGCEMPLLVWNGVLVDGHNRYRICREHHVPFAIEEKEFEDMDAAKVWIIKNQLGRRNITDYVKCELVVPLNELLKAEAEKRMLRGKKAEDDPVPNLAQGTGKTRDALASMAGVSHGTMDKARKIIESADEETKDKLRKGQISIHKAYSDIRKAERAKEEDEQTDSLGEENLSDGSASEEMETLREDETKLYSGDEEITKPEVNEESDKRGSNEDTSTVAEQNVKKVIDTFLTSLLDAIEGMDSAAADRILKMIRIAGEEAASTVEAYVNHVK